MDLLTNVLYYMILFFGTWFLIELTFKFMRRMYDRVRQKD